jgi:glyoxylase-like metal-dependent hydrolase (beta-lactamase superfamily II)
VALGYPPESITYVAFSHFHGDHVANANAFSNSTWLVHPTEPQAMFAVKHEEESLTIGSRTAKP